MVYLRAITLLAATGAASLLQSGPAVAAAGKSPTSDKVACREVLPTGTILNKFMICMSQAAWSKSPSDRTEDDDYSREYMQLKEPARPEMLKLGTAKWEQLPQLRSKGKVPYVQLVSQARELLRDGTCSLPGQTPARFDILVRYGVKLDEQGRVSEVLVEDSRCALINALVGLVVLARADRGDFKVAAQAQPGWRGDWLNLTLQ